MTPRPPAPDVPGTAGSARTGNLAAVVVSAVALLVVLGLLGGLILLVTIGRDAAESGSTSGPSTSPAAETFLYADVRDAPPIDLVDPDGRPFSLAALRGRQVLVFFGYTHCPDVCPVTIGNVSEVLGMVGPGTQAVFASIDPERDTTAWLKEYVRFMPAGFTALTGTPAQVRSAADAWGVRYARVETDSADAYSMSHTADVFLVDAEGRLRAHFPFGTKPEAMVPVLRSVAASMAGSGGATPTPASAPASAPVAAPPTPAPVASAPTALGALRPEVVSTSVWSGRGPVILALNDEAGRLNDPAIPATVRLMDLDGRTVGPVTAMTAVRPPGVDRVSYVATLNIPRPGRWRLDVGAFPDGKELAGSVEITALDPGTTAAIGQPAPTVHTPTLSDVGGNSWAVTTDPAPYLPLSQRSTTDALAAHQPFVLVVDSTRFRVTPACGKAIVMARYLVYRWSDVAFIHLEPYQYTVVADTPVLSGSIENPPVGPVAAAWGVDGAPWGARSMPWVFVVDGDGIVRAKYQGLMGSDDIDVMLALITGRT
jgi:protein SCO1/2